MSAASSVSCPACRAAIEFHQVDNFRVGICAECGGAWFGSGQLESMVKHGPAALDELVAMEPLGSHAQHAGGSAMCPACNLPLSPSTYGGLSTVHISACYQCGGIFIDATSIEALDANAKQRASMPGGGAFGQSGRFGSKPDMPSPQAKIHSISHNLFNRQRYSQYDPSAGYVASDPLDRAINTVIIADLAMDILSFFG